MRAAYIYSEKERQVRRPLELCFRSCGFCVEEAEFMHCRAVNVSFIGGDRLGSKVSFEFSGIRGESGFIRYTPRELCFTTTVSKYIKSNTSKGF